MNLKWTNRGVNSLWTCENREYRITGYEELDNVLYVLFINENKQKLKCTARFWNLNFKPLY